ncbi:hypothetical protein FNU76_18175 [Chitinimonas arctica]|uniref:PhoD-like phosphatase metallophosphatase domain-containing protein n=1 Tax=Chitinimonas arctica TaxID=2594795 RepID=A0A516SIZ6_9NEIS|nr:alkaline phosphatase D family protein [Chitinimonas arctica]QDQ28117.1 hypothetical protein FNU76_18175 [Chitinimonas arctica]
MKMQYLLLCAALGLGAQAAELAAGPMAGPPSMRGVTLWLQADGAARAAIEYWPEDSQASKRRSAPVTLDASEQFAGKISLFGLEPGRRYGYRVVLNDKPAGKQTYRFATQELWQWRKDAPDFTVLAGSCNYGNEPGYDRPGKPYGDHHLTVFKTMAAQNPDLTLWLGDNLYYREVDFSPEGMAYRWQRDRSQGYLQPLLQLGAHAAIWDDHDYGPNDANSSFVLKGESLKLQKRYWANPSYGLPETPGVFTTFSFNDVDFFMLDDRYWRDDNRFPDAADKAMFGREQMRWLKNALLASTAPFKVIAGGTQLMNKSGQSDSWHDFPVERDDFIEFLNKTKLEGVLFLSGDVHRSELTKVERSGAYPLYDLTCSPMTSGIYVDKRQSERANLVPGTSVMGERNFCQLRFEGSKAERRLLLRVYNDKGELKWEKPLSRKELTYQ